MNTMNPYFIISVGIIFGFVIGIVFTLWYTELKEWYETQAERKEKHLEMKIKNWIDIRIKEHENDNTDAKKD